MIRPMAAVVWWTQRSATALRSLRKCLFRSGDSNRVTNTRSWTEKICETNSSGHTSTASAWSDVHSSRTEGTCLDLEIALIHTSISAKSTTAPASALWLPITSPSPSRDSRVPHAIGGSSPLQFFGIALRGALLFLAQGSEHRTKDAWSTTRERQNRSPD
jgi:hypothetical protein